MLKPHLHETVIPDRICQENSKTPHCAKDFSIQTLDIQPKIYQIMYAKGVLNPLEEQIPKHALESTLDQDLEIQLLQID